MKLKARVPKTIQVNRAAVAIIVAIQFGFFAALLGGFIDLRRLQESDHRRDYQICVLSAERVGEVAYGILKPVSIPENALPALRRSLEERNARAVESIERTRQILAESVKKCGVYLDKSLPNQKGIPK